MKKFALLFCLIGAFVLPIVFNFRQIVIGQEDLEKICQLENLDRQEKTLSQDDYRKLLKKCEKYYQERSVQFGRDITRTEQEIRTLRNQISVIRSRISQLGAEIRRSNLIIQDLGLQIQDTAGSIEKTSFKIEDLREKLVGILRTVYEEEQKSLIEVLLSEATLSGFFDNLMALETLNQRNQEILGDIEDLKLRLEEQKEKLGQEKDVLEGTVRSLGHQKQESEIARRERERIEAMTKAQHKEYIKQKEITEQRAAEIRARLFRLAGIPEAEMPSFGEALQIAQWVQQQTGVRPAFLLSIITQESALARNVGQCYLLNITSGTTYHVTTGRQFPRGINPVRDLPPFLQITSELGRDPLRTRVSCWFNVGRGPNFGWGGAMGPAQFIPSTWMKMRDEVASRTGSSPANPWSVRDSFLAAGLYLSDLGAAANEPRAAARYFGAAVPFPYSSTVMKRAGCLDIFINQGTLSQECEKLVFLP